MSGVLEKLLGYGRPEGHLAQLRQALEEGRRPIGWLCRYVPQELIVAAGLYPLRILGNVQQEHAMGDAYLSSITCPYCRSCLDMALQGYYDSLLAMVSVNSCCSMNRAYDVWQSYVRPSRKILLDLPYKSNHQAIRAYREELERLKDTLEELSGNRIEEERIWDSIRLFHDIRRLLSEISALRRQARPPITGPEALSISLAGQLLPPEKYRLLLTQLLGELRERKAYPQGERVRLMVVGSILTDPRYLQIIEDQGGAIVIDDLCSGTRSFQNYCYEGTDPLEALSRAYLGSIPCSRMLNRSYHLDHLLKMIEEYRVEGVIYSVLKFCQSYQYDFMFLEERLKARDIPLLKLEREYTLSGLGQIKTRVQAFLEMIQT